MLRKLVSYGFTRGRLTRAVVYGISHLSYHNEEQRR